MARKMKDSGIEWIGEIPEGWEIRKIKNNFTIYAGATPKSEKNEYWDGGIPWITPADFKTTDKYVSYGRKSLTALGYDSCGTTLVPAGSIIFSKRAPVGSVVIAKNTLCTNQGCLACIPNDAVNSTYFYYCMSIFTEQFELVSAGTTFKEIAASTFASFLLPCPPLSQQNEIVNFLDKESSRIDSMLSKTRSSIEEYKKLKQAIITQAVTKGVRGEREMKDSGVEWIGEIPKAWIISNIGRFCFVTKLAGFEYTKEMDGHISPYGDVPIVRAQNIKMGRFIPNTREYISLALSQKLSRCALNEKCLIITFIGAGIGEVALFSNATRHHLAPNVAKIVINHDMKQFLDDRFLLYFLMSSAGQEEVNKIKKATAQPSLSMQTIRSIKLAFPSTLQEQKEIADFLDAKCAEIDGLIAKKEQLVKELESYKKNLIYEVVTGKREV